MRPFVILTFVLCLLTTVGSTYEFISTIGLLDRVKIVELTSHNLLVTLLNAETGQRGYIITGDPGYLVPYNSALSLISVDLAELRAAARGDLTQAEHISAIIEVTGEKIDELASTIAIRDNQGLVAASLEVKKHLGKNLMDSLRLHFDAVQLLSETNFALYESRGVLYGRIAMFATMLTLMSGSFLMFSSRR